MTRDTWRVATGVTRASALWSATSLAHENAGCKVQLSEFLPSLTLCDVFLMRSVGADGVLAAYVVSRTVGH